jgi:hypothetical protein
VDVLKILEIFGLFFQIFAGALFLLDQTLKYWNTTLNKFIKKLQEWIYKRLITWWVIAILIVLVVIGIIGIYFYYMQTNDLSNTSFTDLAIGTITALVFVLASYTFLLKYTVKLMERWRVTKRFIQDKGLGSFISLNLGISVVSLLGMIIIVPIDLLMLKHVIPLIFLIALLLSLLVFGLGIAFAVSLLVAIILSVLKYFASLSRKWFWTEVLIMWVVGGILLLIVACCN